MENWLVYTLWKIEKVILSTSKLFARLKQLVINHNPLNQTMELKEGVMTLRTVLNKLAPGTPPFNRKRSTNPMAYHKYTDGPNYSFYVMEYIVIEDDIRFWGYEVDKDPENTLTSWYRSISARTILGAKLPKDTNFKPTPALDVPDIGRRWISPKHDTKRDHLAAKYIRKYYRAFGKDQLSLAQDLTTLYHYWGEKLDRQYLYGHWVN